MFLRDDYIREHIETREPHFPQYFPASPTIVLRIVARNQGNAHKHVPAPERHAAARGQEVQLIDLHHVVKVATTVTTPPPGSRQRMGIQAVTTTQRTTMEGDQGGHALPVRQQSMPIDTHNTGQHFFFHHRLHQGIN